MEAAAFRATLALLESAKRCNLVGKLEQFGHVFTTIKQRVGDSLELKSSLQIFDWASAQK
jgi:hypothetical protein